jgi:hypothetical protein
VTLVLLIREMTLVITVNYELVAPHTHAFKPIVVGASVRIRSYLWRVLVWRLAIGWVGKVFLVEHC